MSGYIGTQPVPQATQHRETFTATAGQTSFATAGYTPQFLDVYLNGIHLLNPEDYTASNGSDVVLTTGAALDDVLEVISYSPFEVANQTFTGDTSTDNLSVTGAFTSKGIDDNATSTAMTLDASGNLLVGTTDSNPVANNITSGVQFGDGRIRVSRADRAVLELNRKTSDGTIAEFRKDGTTVGSIMSYAGDMVTGNGDVGIRWEDGTDTLTPWNASTNTPRVSAINLGAPSVPFKDLYLSGGVYLGGTGAANYLQDYETGNWTPTVTSGAISSVNTATYVKIGKMVFFQCDMGLSGTRGSEQFFIGGLPFTCLSSGYTAVSGYHYQPVSSYQQVVPLVFSNTTNIGWNAMGTNVPANQFGNGYINVSGCYPTS